MAHYKGFRVATSNSMNIAFIISLLRFGRQVKNHSFGLGYHVGGIRLHKKDNILFRKK